MIGMRVLIVLVIYVTFLIISPDVIGPKESIGWIIIRIVIRIWIAFGAGVCFCYALFPYGGRRR